MGSFCRVKPVRISGFGSNRAIADHVGPRRARSYAEKFCRWALRPSAMRLLSLFLRWERAAERAEDERAGFLIRAWGGPLVRMRSSRCARWRWPPASIWRGERRLPLGLSRRATTPASPECSISLRPCGCSPAPSTGLWVRSCGSSAALSCGVNDWEMTACQCCFFKMSDSRRPVPADGDTKCRFSR